uniref:SET domain-containing protein n=1 Tax=Phytophthora ramorum TaxID=164328 RepID=H3H669_PHYRM
MAGLAASQLPPEELHAGDKIAYYSMAFVCGNPQGYREAIVLKVDADPGVAKPLDLDSSDIISSTQMLKRLVDRWGNAIVEGGALWRKLRTFTLVPGEHEAPTRASTFNRAMQEAVRQAFAAAHSTEHAPREELACAVSERTATSRSVTVSAPASDVSGSSAARTGERAPSRGAPCTTSHGRRVLREDSPPIGMDVCRDMVSTDIGDPRVVQAASSAAVGAMQLQHSEMETPRDGEGHASEASRGSDDRETQDGDIVANSQLVAVSDYLQSIPTRLKRAKIRHQAKKRPARWHVPRSRKRRDQKKCAVTRSGMNIYHAHTVKARSTKETLQRAGVKDRLRALHVRRPKFVETRTETLDLMKVVIWPTSVLPITESQVPQGLEFPDIGDGDLCQCFGDCFMDSCKIALLSIYCTPECCSLGGACSNSPRNHPGLKLYDTCRVGLGVHTTAYIEVGDVVGEYVGRLFEYPAVLEGQSAQAIKQNSGYTMLLNTQSVSGMFVYIEALKCGSITRFMSHSCDPHVEFVEMQNESKIKVLARMIKTVWPGTQLTVNYGDEIWFKCGCDSCWVDPVDEVE